MAAGRRPALALWPERRGSLLGVGFAGVPECALSAQLWGNMRHSKRTYCPDWDDKDWDYGKWRSSSSHKRRKRSHSSARENKRCKYNHSKMCDSHYLESRSINEKDYHSRRYIDEYRNDYNQGCEPGHRHRDHESRYQNHSSKSSGRSGRSSYKSKHRIHHSTSHRRSHGKSHRRKRTRSVEDDEEGHLICQSGDVLSARYEIVDTLGEGAFGKVVECIDHKVGGRHVAVKIVKNVDRYCEAARSEIQVLEHLNTTDPNSTFRCVQMLEWFEHHGHICIVFELLGLSTYDFIKENGFLPFRLDHIRKMAYQICKSVNSYAFLTIIYDFQKRDERTLINPDIKVVDFGSATYDDEHHSTLEFMLSQDVEHECLFDLIQKMLEYDPAKRITLKEALKHPFFDLLKKTL
ncbi:hypothetical protein H8959_000177 [Pygathrix nigripes]